MKKNVLELLEETAKRFPNNVAIKDEISEITFSNFIEQAKKIGSFISENHEFNFPRPIIVLIDRKKDNIISFMGVVYSRNFYVPVDSKTPIERLKSIVEVLDPIAIIGFTEQQLNLSFELQGNIPFYLFDNLLVNNVDNDKLDELRKKAIDLDPVYAIFTSGSTGVPKAVLISHRSVLDLANWLVVTFNFDSEDVIGNQTPFYFDASVKDIYITLSTGAKMVIIPQKCFAFPKLLGEVLLENKITTALWATSAVVLVAKSGILENLELKSLRRLFFAGEAMFGKHLNIWRKRFPNCNFINLYGPTEVTVDSTYYIVDREFLDNDVIPIGKNCNNKEIFLLDDNNRISQKNEGELAVRGTGVALGYYNNPDQTASVFIQNPQHNNYRDIIYKTGDHVRINNYGEIEFVGRKDFQVKHQGNRIELGEIEAAMYGISNIKHVACIYDENNSKIVLYYSADNEIDANLIIKELSKSIPKYMYPSKFEFIKEMPLSANTKVDRKALKSMLNANH